MQKILGLRHGKFEELILPSPSDEVMVGVKWGAYDSYFTPAYWAAQLWLADSEKFVLNYRLGKTLKEEVAVCLLGGYGIKGEVSYAAFEALKAEGLLDTPHVQEENINKVLKNPLPISGKNIRYRYPNKRAHYLAPILNHLSEEEPTKNSHKGFRDWFLKFKGIGYKTASWITRNWLDSCEVAILDIHIIRCGLICGFFSASDVPYKNYMAMEDKYLDFSRRISAHPGQLDVLMWQQMRHREARPYLPA